MFSTKGPKYNTFKTVYPKCIASPNGHGAILNINSARTHFELMVD